MFLLRFTPTGNFLCLSFLYGRAPLHFIPAGNCSPIVSCPPWLHSVSYPQETVGERFPVRLDSMVFHTDRKLFAYSFLFGLAPLHFISAGNYSRKVSCPTWLHSISYRQETFCEGFPVRLDSTVFLTHRKLFAYSFLSALAPWRFLPAGNCSRRVSHSAWLYGVACPQETVGERFPVRLDSTVFLTDRKLFAYSFLSDLTPWFSLPTGNCSRMVSCPAWLHGVACPQETVREGFPIRLGSMAFLTHRKLFAKGFLSDLAPWCSLPTGNFSLPLLPL